MEMESQQCVMLPDGGGEWDVECLAWVPRLGVRGVTWGWRRDLMQHVVALDAFLASLPYGWQGRGWRSRWEAAWDVLNCCKWDVGGCALGFK